MCVRGSDDLVDTLAQRASTSTMHAELWAYTYILHADIEKSELIVFVRSYQQC